MNAEDAITECYSHKSVLGPWD